MPRRGKSITSKKKSAKRRPVSRSAAYVALLRGVNVGGKNILPMAALTQMFCDAGCENVRTYIQSGNVVFTAPGSVVNTIPGLISQRIEKKFGFQSPIVVRSVVDMQKVIAGNPFLRDGVDPEGGSLHVVFLANAPEAKRIAALDPRRSPGDFFHVRGGEIYLHVPNGIGKTRLSNAWFDSTLATISTGRNWRTVLTLHEMLRQLA